MFLAWKLDFLTELTHGIPIKFIHQLLQIPVCLLATIEFGCGILDILFNGFISVIGSFILNLQNLIGIFYLLEMMLLHLVET